MTEDAGRGEGPVARMLRERLEATFAPRRLVIENQSERHRGHAGWDPSGESHFAVLLVAEAFEGKSRLARHRAVHAALGELLRSRIHALSIRALTPAEAAARGDEGEG